MEDVKSVEKLAESYKDEVFKDYKVEILHGKMKPKDKEKVMQDFKDNKISILISTCKHHGNRKCRKIWLSTIAPIKRKSWKRRI